MRWCVYSSSGIHGGARLTFLRVHCSCAWNGYCALSVAVLALVFHCGLSFRGVLFSLHLLLRVLPVWLLPGHASPLSLGGATSWPLCRGRGAPLIGPRPPRVRTARVCFCMCLSTLFEPLLLAPRNLNVGRLCLILPRARAVAGHAHTLVDGRLAHDPAGRVSSAGRARAAGWCCAAGGGACDPWVAGGAVGGRPPRVAAVAGRAASFDGPYPAGRRPLCPGRCRRALVVATPSLLGPNHHVGGGRARAACLCARCPQPSRRRSAAACRLAGRVRARRGGAVRVGVLPFLGL